MGEGNDIEIKVNDLERLGSGEQASTTVFAAFYSAVLTELTKK